MPISSQILTSIGLMYARFEGCVTVEEAVQAFKAYGEHPDYAPGQKHFVDLSRVTEFSADYTDLLQFFATMDAGTPSTRSSTLFVYYAPSEVSRTMSNAAVKTWSASSHIVVRVLDTEKAALDVLGLPHDTIAEMLNAAKSSNASTLIRQS